MSFHWESALPPLSPQCSNVLRQTPQPNRAQVSYPFHSAQLKREQQYQRVEQPWLPSSKPQGALKSPDGEWVVTEHGHHSHGPPFQFQGAITSGSVGAIADKDRISSHVRTVTEWRVLNTVDYGRTEILFRSLP